jgi:FOG: Ankyrin repeat
MKRAIFAVVFCLAAAGTAAAADDTLAGLIQAGHRDAALKMIAAGADVNAAQGDGTTPLHWAVYKIDADLVRALSSAGRSPMSSTITARALWRRRQRLPMRAWSKCCSMQAAT